MKQTGDALAREYQAGTLYNHSFKQIAAFVEDLELVPPGVTDAMAWMPGSPSQSPPPQSGWAHPGGRRQKARGRDPSIPARMTVSSGLAHVSTINTGAARLWRL